MNSALEQRLEQRFEQEERHDHRSRNDLAREVTVNIDPKLMEIIVCPDCHGKLVAEGEELVCQGCGLAYPVRDDIPVMLIDEAERWRE